MNSHFTFTALRDSTLRLTISAALLLGAAQAHSAIRVGDSTAEGVAAGKTPELVLIIWDPVKEVSYFKDLGVNVYKENYASGTPATNLYVYGQQDTGYQKLFDPLNTDPNFTNFLTKSTDRANQIWAVIGVSNDPDAPAFANGTSIFSTLNANTATGTTNPEYTRLINWTSGDMSNAGGSLAGSMGEMSSQAGTCAQISCFEDYAANTSYVFVKGQLGYAGGVFSAGGAILGGSSSAPGIFNSVNRSSWFYTMTVASEVTNIPILVDEFDNGILGNGHDAYWGLGVNAQGEYILSYTLEASLTQAQTVQGQMLRLRTDFAAHYGNTRLIGAPVGDTLDLSGGTTITPVPEPSTWGLMGLGLALLAGRARRQKNA
ncbi:PEP-CTERM sorting domain-containing protein [Roseateles sp. DXS20W]|uniref:PEP-CTERM sorting domain-containing protein n=1 Tax=Pelomonas lactea TaxID=3299030 RepID=A0ABW7GDQ9_9BURK